MRRDFSGLDLAPKFDPPVRVHIQHPAPNFPSSRREYQHPCFQSLFNSVKYCWTLQGRSEVSFCHGNSGMMTPLAPKRDFLPSSRLPPNLASESQATSRRAIVATPDPSSNRSVPHWESMLRRLRFS